MTQNHKISFLCSFVAFVLLVIVRFYWLEYASSHEAYLFDGTVMINNHDGYYYAEGARDRLAGFHQLGDLSPISSPLSILTALIVQITSCSLDTVILFMPALFGSLIAFPVYRMMLQFTSYSHLSHACSFLCAFMSGIVVSYYNRTMMGYYDTDMLLLVWVLGFYYFFFKIYNKKDFYHPFDNVCMILLGTLACWWHQGLQNLFLALWFLLFVGLIIHKQSDKFEKILHLNAMVTLLTIPSNLLWQWGLTLVYLTALLYSVYSKNRISWYAMIGFMIFSVWMGCFDGVLYQIKVYFFQSIPEKSDLIFYDVMGTIREVKGVGFEELGERISSHVFLFVLSLVGFAVLCYQKPVFLLTLPFVLLGLVGYKIGLRFNILATPFMAISLIFLLWSFLDVIRLRLLQLMIFLSAVIMICYPSFKHIMDYQVPTVFHHQEAKILSSLKQIATPDDYVITWWDYGYGVRYYGDVKTLIDGGKHSGSANYPVSYMLTTPNVSASALFASIATYTTEQHLLDEYPYSVMEWIMKDASVPVYNWLLGLENGVWEVPSKTYDIFYYIPFKIFSIFNTIEQFSNINLETGETMRDHFFYFSHFVYEEGEKVHIESQEGQMLILDIQKGFLQTSSTQGIKLKEVIVLDEEKGRFEGDFIETFSKQTRIPFYADSSLRALYFKAQKAVILVDEYHFYATALQLFINDHHENFELVASNPMARIFKVRQ